MQPLPLQMLAWQPCLLTFYILLKFPNINLVNIQGGRPIKYGI